MKTARNTVAGKAQAATALAEHALVLLGDAEQIGESGDAGNRCIWIARDMITNAVKRLERPSRKTLGLAQGDFYDAHSVLTAVVALQRKDGRALLAKAAAGLLDTAADTVDGICSDGDEIQESVRLSAFAAADFEFGRSLVLGMMREGEDVGFRGYTSAQRYVRDGQAQDRYARKYLEVLGARPELLEGFSAVLSVALNHQDNRLDPDVIEGLPLAEFEAGVPGEDGTDVGCWEPSAARAACKISHVKTVRTSPVYRQRKAVPA